MSMNEQMSLAATGFERHTKTTRRTKFLRAVERVRRAVTDAVVSARVEGRDDPARVIGIVTEESGPGPCVFAVLRRIRRRHAQPGAIHRVNVGLTPGLVRAVVRDAAPRADHVVDRLLRRHCRSERNCGHSREPTGDREAAARFCVRKRVVLSAWAGSDSMLQTIARRFTVCSCAAREMLRRQLLDEHEAPWSGDAVRDRAGRSARVRKRGREDIDSVYRAIAHIELPMGIHGDTLRAGEARDRDCRRARV